MGIATMANTTKSIVSMVSFAAFFILIFGWPLNSFIAKRSIRIQTGVLSALDKRMGVLNELIGAVCYILIRALFYA